MIQNHFLRFFHSTIPAWSSGSKSHLAKLRKKTGFTFSNCKKALELNDNDLVKAEKWLQDQAQALGWSKLSKLEGRATAQGLVGVAYEGKKAAMVEVNCETDFVARNKNFKEMVNLASNSCLQYLKHSKTSNDILKECFDSEQLKVIEGPDGKKLSDHVALLVSNVGENVSLRRALCFGVKDKLDLACYVHPDQSEAGNVMSGKYAAIIIYSAAKKSTSTTQLIRQLCQHVIGMNPKRICKDPDEMTDKREVEVVKKDVQEVEKDVQEVEKDDEEVGIDQEEKQEDALMAQDFLLDPSITVQELLSGTDITIHDFVRLETGEKIVSQDTPEEKVAACQMGA